MDFNLQVETLKLNIEQILNQSDLPFSVKYLILQILKLEYEKQYYGKLNSVLSQQTNEEDINTIIKNTQINQDKKQ